MDTYKSALDVILQKEDEVGRQAIEALRKFSRLKGRLRFEVDDRDEPINLKSYWTPCKHFLKHCIGYCPLCAKEKP